MASIISLNDEIANQRKCEKIIQMLDHRLIKNDFAFKDLCFSLINNSSNLDKILADINLYLQSKTVLKAETINFVADNVCSWGACSSILLTVKYYLCQITHLLLNLLQVSGGAKFSYIKYF